MPEKDKEPAGIPAPAPAPEPKLEEERPETPAPTKEQVDRILNDAIQAAERAGGPNANPGGTPAGSGPNVAGIEADRKARLEALEASKYGQATKKTGGPLFSAAELALLDTPADKVNPKRKEERLNLIKKFSAWKVDERARIEKEHQARVVAAADQRGRELEVSTVQTLTGKEPFQNWNMGIQLGQTFEILAPETSELVFSEADMDKMKADMAEVMLRHPELRKWLLLHSAEARLTLMFLLCFKGKLNKYKAAKEKAATKGAAT